jgi:glyoxylase-like metal-dependent hydrolase (beta-lactamase superfamily II)
MADVFRVGAVTITRVPYFDVPLPADGVGLTADDLAAAPWAVPDWATADGEVLIGQAVWVVESEGAVIVVDPCGAADEFIRSGPDAVTHQEAVLAAVTAAGFAPDRVDLVVLTHLDGIGMAAVVDADGRWSPAFPGARIVVTAEELDCVLTGPPVQGAGAFRELVDAGAVDAVQAPHACTGEVTIELTGGHTPGHAVVRIASGGQEAVMLGHLAVSPVHVTATRRPGQHQDPDRAAAALDRIMGSGSLLIGSLWPSPGAGTASGTRGIVAYRP